jgi:hypothetical protein
MRTERPIKRLRRTSVAVGEIDEPNRVAGASGKKTTRRRPGRAASIMTINATQRSNRWRNPEKGGPARRRGNLAKGSHTTLALAVRKRR